MKNWIKYFVFPFSIGGLLFYISVESIIIEFSITLLVLTILLLLVNLIFIPFNLKISKTILPFTTTLLIWLTGMYLYNRVYLVSENFESVSEEITYKLDEYKALNGHFPDCNSSRQLIDSLNLNGNEIYLDYFEYKLDSNKEYYILKIIENGIVVETIDSKDIEMENKKYNSR